MELYDEHVMGSEIYLLEGGEFQGVFPVILTEMREGWLEEWIDEGLLYAE
jgi:hypothetical protein